MADLKATLKAVEDLRKFRRFNQIEFFEPYPKQVDFFALGARKRERMLMAGNQLGKTYAGAAEVTHHLTGIYPADWNGRRWDRPVRGWAAGESSLMVRDVQQKLLCGEPGVDAEFGTGMIPKHLFVDKPSLARGVTDAYDTIQVRHKSGGISVLRFKSYEQGRKKFQGETIDFAWGDEEPPLDVYSEILTRITATKGMVFITFTPLQGMSLVVARYLNEPSEDRGYITMTIEDAKHIAPEGRATIIAGYPAHERDARARGIPMLGSGRVFQVSEEAILEPAIDFIPEHWFKMWALDFGIGHPFAAVLGLYDKDADCIHIHAALRLVDLSPDTSPPMQHAKPMKAIAANVPVAWPQDGTARDKGSGKQLAALYKAEGLQMLPEHATWPDGSISTEAGIMEMQDRMTSGRFKVAAHLSQWLEEFRLYHRKDGIIVKERDDLMSASRVFVMAKRFAKQVVLGNKTSSRKPQSYIAEGTLELDTGYDD